MKKNKGITLIALILTIVIMLILLAVGASYIINDNLIGRADNTVKAANNKINQQQTIVDDLMGELNKSTAAHDWQYTDETRVAIKCVCDDCKEAANSTEGRILYIGQQIMYTSTGTGSSSISEEKSGIAQAKADEQSWATSYGVQTVNIASDDTKWVVLGVEDSNKNGTNETLLLTTETPTTETIRMYGYQPYNYAIDEINRMCKEIYGAEARGMTIEDVNACVQYTAPAGMCAKNNSGTIVYYTVPEGTKISDLGSSYGNIWTDIQNNARVIDGTKKYFTPSCPEGTTDASVLGNIIVDGYSYVVDSTVGAPEGIPVLPDSTTSATKKLIFGDSKNYGYWLASRGVYAGSVCADFGPGTVIEGIAYSFRYLFNSGGSSNVDELPLRCVVSLRSDIPAAVE